MTTQNAFDNPAYYINRELSWLSFNERVLDEAQNEDNPFLERLKFLAITSSNLDEFFMVRIAGLKEQILADLTNPDNKTRMSPHAQWEAALARISDFVKRQGRVWNEVLLPTLESLGIVLVTRDQLTPDQSAFVSDTFSRMIYPVLTPLAVDPSRPFPRLFNRSLNLAVLLKSDAAHEEPPLFAFVQVPRVLPRLFRIPNADGQRYILLEEIIRMHLSWLFRGKHIVSSSAFRITRNADLTFNIEPDSDLLEEIERELPQRETGDAVRMEVERNMHPFLRDLLERQEGVSPREVFTQETPLDLTFLMKLANQLDLKDHRFPEFHPVIPPELQADSDIFKDIRDRDILLYHPYESFEPVVRFVRQAAGDPQVLAIKQTLYRVGGDSPIVAALSQAAMNGKQVTVLVELRARFDEEKNIEWAKTLEKAGCHVIYGLAGLKTHTKMCFVVRQEDDHLQRYVHLDTGNYNESTANLYTDFSLFTANADIAEDVAYIFNRLSGYSSLPPLHCMSVAPWELEKTFLAEIENVIAHSTPGHRGHIIAKMNSLTNKDIIQALYRASCAGVAIDLIVRGICCLRPGLPGVSENIRVYSIVGRFLEHGRAYYFDTGLRETLFLSSADWMTRNFEQRVETLFPILHPDCKNLVLKILQTQLRDNVKRRELMPDGTYVHVLPHSGEERINSQEKLLDVISAAIGQVGSSG